MNDGDLAWLPRPVRAVTAEDVRALVPMRDAISAVRAAFVSTSNHSCDMSPRIGLSDGRLLVMSARMKAERGAVVKAVTITPTNPARGLPLINGLVIWIDTDDGQPVAVIDGTALTALRTGAASGVATDLLAPPDASVLAVIGAGGQASLQIEAVAEVRRLTEVRIASRTLQSAEALRERMQTVLPALPMRVVRSIREAVSGADVICCATNSTQALFTAGDVGPQVHVNAIGAYTPAMCEVPADLLKKAGVIAVDQFEAAMTGAGDLIQAIKSGAIDSSQLVEIGVLLLREAEVSRNKPTIFKSVGIAAQDWAVARLIGDRLSVRHDEALEVARGGAG